MSIGSFFEDISAFINNCLHPGSFMSLLPWILKAITCVIFIAVTSGEKILKPRKIAPAAVTFVLLLLSAVFGSYYNRVYSWLAAVLGIALLYLCSRLCGEKKRTRAFSLSAIAINAETLADSIYVNSRFELEWYYLKPEEAAPKILGSISLMRALEYVVAAVLFAVLFAAAFYLRKKKISLDRRAGTSVAVSLLISTVLINFFELILNYNYTYIYVKSVSLESSRRTVVFSIISLLLILLLNVTIYVLITIINKRNMIETENAVMKQQYAGQSAIIEEITRRHGALSQMRHDLSSSLGTVNELIKAGKYDEASKYIEKQTGRLTTEVRNVDTNNEYVNSLIGYEISRAKEAGVEVSVRSVKEIDFPDDLDLCNLIGNMFDNAIRAAAECGEEGTVRLDVLRDKEAYRISMLNSVKSPVMASNPDLETTKDDKTAHGFGTKIIKEIAEKYYGSTDFYDTPDGKFCCSVLVYPQKPY